jgi:CBS domain-containing protein
MRVKDLMNRNVETCEAGDDLAKAAMIMWRQDCGIVPVVEDGGRVMGVVTDRDICIAAATQHCPPEKLNVGHVMARQPASTSPDEDIEAALERMGTYRVRRLPVVDNDGRIAGMLSIADVIEGMPDGKDRELTAQLVHTMREICSRAPDAQRAVGATGR